MEFFLTLLILLSSIGGIISSLESKDYKAILIVVSASAAFLSSLQLVLIITDFLVSPRSKAKRIKHGFLELFRVDQKSDDFLRKKSKNLTTYCNPFQEDTSFCSHKTVLTERVSLGSEEKQLFRLLDINKKNRLYEKKKYGRYLTVSLIEHLIETNVISTYKGINEIIEKYSLPPCKDFICLDGKRDFIFIYNYLLNNETSRMSHDFFDSLCEYIMCNLYYNDVEHLKEIEEHEMEDEYNESRDMAQGCRGEMLGHTYDLIKKKKSSIVLPEEVRLSVSKKGVMDFSVYGELYNKFDKVFFLESLVYPQPYGVALPKYKIKEVYKKIKNNEFECDSFINSLVEKVESIEYKINISERRRIEINSCNGLNLEVKYVDHGNEIINKLYNYNSLDDLIYASFMLSNQISEIVNEDRFCCFVTKNLSKKKNLTWITKREYYYQHCTSIERMINSIMNLESYYDFEVLEGLKVFEGIYSEKLAEKEEELLEHNREYLKLIYGEKNASLFNKYLEELKIVNPKIIKMLVEMLRKNINFKCLYKKYDCPNWMYKRRLSDMSYFKELSGGTSIKGTDFKVNPTRIAITCFKNKVEKVSHNPVYCREFSLAQSTKKAKEIIDNQDEKSPISRKEIVFNLISQNYDLFGVNQSLLSGLLTRKISNLTTGKYHSIKRFRGNIDSSLTPVVSTDYMTNGDNRKLSYKDILLKTNIIESKDIKNDFDLKKNEMRLNFLLRKDNLLNKFNKNVKLEEKPDRNLNEALNYKKPKKSHARRRMCGGSENNIKVREKLFFNIKTENMYKILEGKSKLFSEKKKEYTKYCSFLSKVEKMTVESSKTSIKKKVHKEVVSQVKKEKEEKDKREKEEEEKREKERELIRGEEEKMGIERQQREQKREEALKEELSKGEEKGREKGKEKEEEHVKITEKAEKDEEEPKKSKEKRKISRDPQKQKEKEERRRIQEQHLINKAKRVQEQKALNFEENMGKKFWNFGFYP